MGLLTAAGVLGLVGLVSAGMLAVASRVFAVKIDDRITAILGVLPGANCGGCGYAGCSGYAAAIVNKGVDPAQCAPAGPAGAKAIGAIMGVEVADKVKVIARVRCGGTHEKCKSRFEYRGLKTCQGAVMLNEGGAKSCPYGCEGLGDCVEACVFGAMHMGDDGIPLVDAEKCTGCGKCVAVCPKDVIELQAWSGCVAINCNSQWKGKDVKNVCEVGCISCLACVKACPWDAIAMNGNIPVINYEKCRSCGLCIDSCKPGSIVALRAIDEVARAEGQRIIADRKAAKAAAAAQATPAS
jgi:Na+-translocating ferredoxin:NAD+ oxidoreductase RNF subunit RnfB